MAIRPSWWISLARWSGRMTAASRRSAGKYCDTSPQFITPGEVAADWWQRLDGYARTCHGDSFRSQRELELRALTEVVERFESHLAPGI